MATSTLIPLASHTFFRDIELLKDFRPIHAEPASKRQKLESDVPNYTQQSVGVECVMQTEATSPPSIHAHEHKNSHEQNDLSTPSFDFKTQLQLNVLQWELLHQREQELIQQAKLLLASSSSDVNASATHSTQFPDLLKSEISTLMEQKNNTLGPLIQIPNTGISEEAKRISIDGEGFGVTITQQPPDAIVANQFIDPAPILQISNFKPSGVQLFVSVQLFYDSEKEIQQDILQGTTRVSVDSDGSAIFDKLLITEVSAKHKYQAFCFIFSLEEVSNGSKRIISTTKSGSFHTQSRPTRSVKRKKEEDAYGSSSDEDFVVNLPEKIHVEVADVKTAGLVLQ